MSTFAPLSLLPQLVPLTTEALRGEADEDAALARAEAELAQARQHLRTLHATTKPIGKLHAHAPDEPDPEDEVDDEVEEESEGEDFE